MTAFNALGLTAFKGALFGRIKSRERCKQTLLTRESLFTKRCKHCKRKNRSLFTPTFTEKSA